MQEFVRQYEQLLIDSGLSTSTIKAYIRDIDILMFYIHDPKNESSLENLNDEDLRKILAKIRARRRTSGVQHWIKSINRFLNHCVAQGLRRDNPMQAVAAEIKPRAADRKEIAKKLIDYLDGDDRKAQKNRAIAVILCCTAIKICSYCKLTVGDIDFERQVITDDKKHVYRLNNNAIEILRKYILCTFYGQPEPGTLLFCSAKNHEITQNYLWRMFKNALNEIGTDATPINLRGVLAE